MSPPASTRDALTDPEWENYFSPGEGRSETLEEALARVPAFSGLDAEALATLARQVHLRTFARGQVVIRRGAPQSGFYLIRSGSVHVVREGPGGREVTGTLGPPEILGRFALLDDGPRGTSVIAAERSELAGFFRPDLMDIVATDPGLGCRILLRMGEEMSAALNEDYARLQDLGRPFEGAGEGLDPRL